MAADTKSIEERREMVEPAHPKLSIFQQCILLSFCRSSYYYVSRKGESVEDIEIKFEIDKIFTRCPFYGVKRITCELRRRLSIDIGQKRVRRYLREMHISAIYPKPKMTCANKEHKVYPYLLRNIKIVRVNQVWSTDITYIPMNGGYMYLCAVIDWYSRTILAWGISNTHDSEFCQEVLKEAISMYGKPEIFNTDQGSEFTAKKFIEILETNDIQISMDGKGRALDNIFIERFWRSLKYEYLYISLPSNVKELRKGLEDYFQIYNEERPHQSLGYKTPMTVYLAA